MELAAHRLFAAFDPPHRDNLLRVTERLEVPAGALLFVERDPPDAIYVVLEGRVELAKSIRGESFEVIAVAPEDDYFGEVGALDGSGRSTCARAAVASVVGRIPAEPFLHALREGPGRAALAVYSKIVGNIRDTNDRLIGYRLSREKMSLVGEMAGSIVHDLRGPYSGIRLAVEMIEEKHDDAETVELCHLVIDQIGRSLAMLDELLQFSRGTASLNRERVLLSDMAARFERLNRDFLATTKVSLKTDVPKVEVEVDQDKILRVLQNLVNNAIEAMGDRVGHISLTGSKQGGYVDLEVRDDGPGIPLAIRDRLFEPFVTHGKANGTGLGMAITRSVVEAHKGQISVKETSPAGTVFLIRLPLAG